MRHEKISGKFERISLFLKKFRIPSKIIFLIIGILSTIWFLIRVIPKPSRATYPCVQASAPWASAFVIYLLGLSASYLSFKRFGQNLKAAKYSIALVFLLGGLSLSLFTLTQNNNNIQAALIDGSQFIANSPVGVAKGANPGRVVWVWNPDATNEDMTNSSDDYWFMDKNANTPIIEKMLEDGIKNLAGKGNLTDAWDVLFKYFNQEQGKGAVGYTSGEKVMVKINLTNSSNGMDGTKKVNNLERMDATPQLCYAILKQLIDVIGIAQEDITLGDPYRIFRDFYWDKCQSVYPNVNYLDGHGMNGRTTTQATTENLLQFSNRETSCRIPQQYVDAAYFINIPCLKSHESGGITISAKNHQGSVLEDGDPSDDQSAYWLHDYFPERDAGNGKYRHLVDYMGHEHLGGKTLLHLVDGIWAGRNWHGWVEKWEMYPFNNDYPSSLILSQDQVAIESVCFDFLLEEYKDKPDNQKHPYMDGTEDYILQAADKSNWPDGISYDPEDDGTEIPSLGVYEHWNNSIDMDYTRNLGTGDGIELIKVFGDDSKIDVENSGLLSNQVNAVYVDSSNIKWFGTDKGLSRFTGNIWDTIDNTNHLLNNMVSDIAYERSGFGPELWLATEGGLSVLAISELDGVTSATTYHRGNSRILSDTITAVGVDIKHNRWIGTAKGISLFGSEGWDSLKHYNNSNGTEHDLSGIKITDIESHDKNEQAYLSTLGGGVLKYEYDEIDGFTGASTYDSIWSGLQTSRINSVSIKDTTEWFGSIEGAYKHEGDFLKTYWRHYTTDSGIVSNTITTTYIDSKDNVWIGTDNGLSIKSRTAWYQYKTKDGLIDPTVNSICEDMIGNIWIGTNGGVQWFSDIPGTKIAFPGIPLLESPENKTEDKPLDVILSWKAAENAISYRLQLATSIDMSLIIIDENNLTETSYLAEELSKSTKYYWRVQTNSSELSSQWSEIWSFTTTSIELSTPILSLPANNSENQPINMSVYWQAVNDAEAYRLQIDDAPSFLSPVIDINDYQSTSFILSGLNKSTNYYWRVRAKTGEIVSPWSESWRFKTGTSTGIFNTTDDTFVRVFPNPASEYLNIQINSELSEALHIELYTLNGTKLAEQNYSISEVGSSVRFDLTREDIKTGVYLIKIVTDNKFITKRIVIE